MTVPSGGDNLYTDRTKGLKDFPGTLYVLLHSVQRHYDIRSAFSLRRSGGARKTGARGPQLSPASGQRSRACIPGLAWGTSVGAPLGREGRSGGRPWA